MNHFEYYLGLVLGILLGSFIRFMKKDENYYKKQFKKLKKSVAEDRNKLLSQLDIMQTTLLFVVKKSKNKKVVITKEDFQNLKPGDKQSMETLVKPNGDVVFQLKSKGSIK